MSIVVVIEMLVGWMAIWVRWAEDDTAGGESVS